MFPLLLCAFLLLSGNGLLATALAVRVADPQLAMWTTPVVAAFSCGLMLGALLAPRVLSRVGHIRTFSLVSGLLAIGCLGMFLFPHPVTWIGARLGGGVAAAAGYVVIESWLAAVTSPVTRGRTLAYYLSLCHLGLAFGQTFLDRGDVGDEVIYAASFYVLALLPLSWTSTAQPVLPSHQRAAWIEVLHTAPVGVCAAALSGFLTGAWGHAGGVLIESVLKDKASVGPLMSLLYVGGLFLQWPIGWLADRVDRRLVLQGLGLLLVVLHLGLMFLPNTPDLFAIALPAVGAVIFVIYPLALAHTQDLAPSESIAGYGSVLLLAYGIGSILGPGLLAPVINFDPHWFFLSLAVAGGILFLVGGARVVFKPRLNIEQTFPVRPILSPLVAPSQELDPGTDAQQLSFSFDDA